MLPLKCGSDAGRDNSGIDIDDDLEDDTYGHKNGSGGTCGGLNLEDDVRNSNIVPQGGPSPCGSRCRHGQGYPRWTKLL